MTTISEIARAADVSVESVLHVLNRDNSVSSEEAARVVAVMEAYGYGPQRAEREAVKRGREGGGRGDAATETRPQRQEANVDADDASGDTDDELLQTVDQRADEAETAAARRLPYKAPEDRLARDLDLIKNELGQARSGRLEDLTLLVDLLTTSWRAVDDRLRAIERKLEEMERSPDQPSSSS